MLSEAIDSAQDHIDEFGIPMCDYKGYDKLLVSPAEKLIRAKNRLKTIQKTNNETQL